MTRKDEPFISFRVAAAKWVNSNPGLKRSNSQATSSDALVAAAALAFPNLCDKSLNQVISKEIGRTRGIVEPKAGGRRLGAPTCTSVSEIAVRHARVAAKVIPPKNLLAVSERERETLLWLLT